MWLFCMFIFAVVILQTVRVFLDQLEADARNEMYCPEYLAWDLGFGLFMILVWDFVFFFSRCPWGLLFSGFRSIFVRFCRYGVLPACMYTCMSILLSLCFLLHPLLSVFFLSYFICLWFFLFLDLVVGASSYCSSMFCRACSYRRFSNFFHLPCGH